MNPLSANHQAAVIRDEAAKQTDPLRRQAMENGAFNLEKMAKAVPAMRTFLAIYEVWPGAELAEVRDIEPERIGL